MKNVALIISGRGDGDNIHEIELHPGSTAGDVLRSVGLGTDYLLSLEGSGNRFAAEEQIYDAVQEGCKLRATPVAEVGNHEDHPATGGAAGPGNGKEVLPC